MIILNPSEVSLSWVEYGTANAWNIEYGPAGFTPGAGTTVGASTNPFTVTGLDPATTYEFYIQADCGGGDVSEWNLTSAYATTECLTLTTFPYTEDFESTTGSLPDCWSNINISGSTSWEATTNAGYNLSSAHSGSKAAFFYQSGRDNSSELISPTFDLTTLTNPTITFWYANPDWGGDVDALTIYYKAAASDSWTQLATYTSGQSWTFDSLALPSPSAEYQLKFYAYSNYGYGIGVDDITIFDADGGDTPATCDTPTGLATSNISQTGATVTWTAGAASAWNVQYKAASASAWSNSIPVTAATYTFSGLTASTQYNVRVQADCGNNLVSDWATVNFTTLDETVETCPQPTNFHAEDITKNSVTLAWDQAAGTATEWEINYKKTTESTWTNISVTTNPYTITNLDANTAYEANIVAHCSNGINSDPTANINFTTLVDGINDYILNDTKLFPNPTTNTITIQNNNVVMTEVAIYDVYGKLLRTVSVNDNTAVVNVADFANGMYFARIISENGMTTKSFIKK